VTGGTYSYLNQTVGGGDLNWNDLAQSTAMGAAVGGVSSVFTPAADVSGMGPQGMFAGYEDIGGLSGAGGISFLDAASRGAGVGTGGLIEGYISTQEQQQTLANENDELALAGTEEVAYKNQQRKELNLFGLGDDPYYDQIGDMESAQEGLF